MAVITGRTLAQLQRGDQADLFVRIEEIATRWGRDGEPYFVLSVSDLSGHAAIKVFADQKAFEPCRQLAPRAVAKVRVLVERSGDPAELKGIGLRLPTPDEPIDLSAVFGTLRPEAEALGIGTIGFDIETTPRLDLAELPEREQSKFLRWASDEARRETGSSLPDDDSVAEALRKVMALTPLTARIVSIAFHNPETGAELALVAEPDALDLEPPALAVDETELLRIFWGVALRARTLVGFNSRRFDAPVLLTRSAQLGIAATTDLLGSRFDRRSNHVDLLDVLHGRGAAGDRRVSLELAAHAFDIPVKQSGHGGEVALLVEEGRFAELAAYNLEDARATALLHQRLQHSWL